MSGPSSRLRVGKGSTSLLKRHQAALGLAAFLVLLVGVNLYVLYYKHDTSVPALLELANAGRRAAIGTHPGTRLIGPPGTPPVPTQKLRRPRAASAPPDYPRVIEVGLKVGDTVSGVLRSHGISGPLGDELQASLRSLLDPGGLGTGQSFTLYHDLDDRLAALDYRLTDSSAFHLERVATGGAERFVSTRQEQTLSEKIASLAVTIDRDGDLVGALVRAGEQPALAARLAEVFACETTLYTDAKAGDRIRFVVEKVLLGGSFYRYGRLLAAEYQPAARPDRPAVPGRPAPRLRAFLSPNVGASLVSAGAAPGATVHYFNESGDSLARTLCRAPLLFGKAPGGLADATAARAMVRPDRGRPAVDYAVPAGTPVVSAGAGRVTFKGVRSPGGLTVVIAHPGGTETTYANLGRLARGLTEGQPVRLRQIIGFVGQPAPAGHAGHASAAPRPHLHFALRVGSKVVDPTRYKAPREAALPASQRPAFTTQVADLMERLAGAEAPAASTELAANADRSLP